MAGNARTLLIITLVCFAYCPEDSTANRGTAIEGSGEEEPTTMEVTTATIAHSTATTTTLIPVAKTTANPKGSNKTPRATRNTNKKKKKKKTKVNPWVIVGAVIGMLIIMALLGGLIYILYKKNYLACLGERFSCPRTSYENI